MEMDPDFSLALPFALEYFGAYSGAGRQCQDPFATNYKHLHQSTTTVVEKHVVFSYKD